VDVWIVKVMSASKRVNLPENELDGRVIGNMLSLSSIKRANVGE
jgi:hypothetical protein